jgi:hypothetical protein
MLRIEPVFNGKTTEVKEYKVIDETGMIWYQGPHWECENWILDWNNNF